MDKKEDLSIDIYHRIYRFAVRKVPVDQIAITLDLPISVVKNIVNHFFSSTKETLKENQTVAQSNTFPDKQSYLDIYILQKLRFSIVDINGMVTEEHNTYLQDELNKVLKSNIKTVAILMANVKAIDETGLSTIVAFYKKTLAKGRYTAILDPSYETESLISEKELEKEIPIFGTEKAFEERALKIKKQK